MNLKKCTKCKTEKSRVDFHKARREPDGLSYWCKACQKEADKKRLLDNPEKERARKEKYRKAHMQERNLARKEWASKNPDKVKEYRRRTYLKNKEKENAKSSEYNKRNRSRLNFIGARRKALQRQATVKWADLNKIRKIYEDCIRITKETGVAHHVDHIIPIKSKYVCGLHVENNLQILTAAENCRKQNRFQPG